MFTRTRAILLVAAIVAPLLVPTAASANTGPTQECSGTYVGVWPGVGFDSFVSTIATNQVGVGTSVSISVAVPAGEYDVSAATYDGSTSRSGDGNQQFEELFLEFIDSQGDVVATTGSSFDLNDYVEEAEWLGSMGSVVLVRDIVTVRATHTFAGQVVGSPQYVHSLSPVCFGALLVPSTVSTTTTSTSTTTTSTTTTSTTTVPESTTTTVPESTTTTLPESSTSTTTVAPTTTVVAPTTIAGPTTTAAPTTTTVPTQVLPEVQENPDPDPVVVDPTFTG
jgi:hypothetical protein